MRILLSIIMILVVVACDKPGGIRFDRDISQELKKQIQVDLEFLASLKGEQTTKLHQEIFGPFNGSSYQDFFKKRIFDVGMDDCGGGPAFACVMPFSDANKMYLSENYVKYSIPQMFRIYTLLHESRHTETKNDNWPHVNCPSPFLDKDGKDIVGIITGRKMEALPACDDVARGAYGIEVVIGKNIEKFCSSCTEKTRADAKLYADDTRKRIIGDEAIRDLDEDN